MFFWTILASLLGVVMFGNWREHAKDPSDFVVPVYQAMALNTYQQHLAAEEAYQHMMSDSPDTVINAIKNQSTINMKAAGSPFGAISNYMPMGYQDKNSARTYLFCISRDEEDHPQEPADCFPNDAVKSTVKYIVTVRPVPAKYQGAAKMSVMRSIAEATNGSRSVGLLTKYNDTGLTEGGNVQYQPLGARYYILSGGTSLAGNVFIPNGIVCNFYLNDEGQKLITGATAGNDYIIAVSMMGGLGDDQNLPSGGWPCN